MKKMFIKLGLVAGVAVVSLSSGGAHALATVQGCTFDDSEAGVWKLTADCTSTAQINIPVGTTVEGNGYTISAGFTKTDNTNNAVIGIINADNVSIRNFTIEGAGGTQLHGVNVYSSSAVVLKDVTVKNNDRSGLVVNGSSVTVENLSTSGNGWNGVNVAQGSGVTTPSVLAVTGVSSHTDGAHIYLDDVMGQTVTVQDTMGQYVISSPVTTPDKPYDKLYTLKKVATEKDQCKSGGWQYVRTSESGQFKNQGQCVAYVASSAQSKYHRVTTPLLNARY